MVLTTGMTDNAILQELGNRLERRRIDAGLTQAELAERAGVSKRTVERIEAGHSTEFVMLIRLLRALELVQGLDSLITDLPQSPIALLKLKGRERQRVRHSRVREPTAARRPWKWGE
jgi:transcriptional regulator with XRE-family HTH domain